MPAMKNARNAINVERIGFKVVHESDRFRVALALVPGVPGIPGICH
jgi:hypothetical protein